MLCVLEVERGNEILLINALLMQRLNNILKLKGFWQNFNRLSEETN